MHYNAVIRTPVGPLGIATHAGRITALAWHPDTRLHEPARDDALAAAVVAALRGWFARAAELPAFPLAPAPSAFAEGVRAAMLAIPPGSTRTYGDIAADLGSSPRAVGGACRRNPLPVIVPCHRVVARAGLGGYSGDWQSGAALSHKQWLLAHEARTRRGAAA